jgi:hypothetical protein
LPREERKSGLLRCPRNDGRQNWFATMNVFGDGCDKPPRASFRAKKLASGDAS